MPYLLLKDKSVLSQSDLYERFPNVLFPPDLSKVDLDAFGLATLESVDEPQVQNGKKAVQDDPYEVSPGVWRQKWSVVDQTKDELIESIAQRKFTMSNDVDGIWEIKTYAGFTYNFGSPTGQKTLQTRQEDQTRWLYLSVMCIKAIAAGMGKNELPLAIRTMDNTDVTVTYQQASDMLDAMGAQQAGLLAYSWALKNAIAAANDHATLDKTDIKANWPA